MEKDENRLSPDIDLSKIEAIGYVNTDCYKTTPVFDLESSLKATKMTQEKIKVGV